MKAKLLTLFVFYSFTSFGQCAIEVSPNSCSESTGLIYITSGAFYDSYQWYSKPMNSTSPFQPILNATSSSFTFDWATYDQSIVKVFCFYSIGMDYFSNDVALDLSNCNLGISNFKSVLSDVKLYPNPAKDYIELDNLERVNQIEIFNSVGQKVLNLNYSINSKINISALLPGIYFLRAKTDDTLLNFKFIKA